MTISKHHWRPTELLLLNAANQRVHSRYQLTGYQERTQGIWFPGHIMETTTNEAGQLLSTSEYELQNAQFNADVDTALLRPPVPLGTNISDFRFGNNAGIGYRVRTHIPTDDYVKQELDKKKVGEEQVREGANRQRWQQNLITSGAAVCGGAMLWLRRRKPKPEQTDNEADAPAS